MKKLVLFFIPIVALSACQKDFLTRDNPTATTDDNFWATQGQLNAALGVIYGSTPTGTYQYKANTRISFSGMTDDAVWTANYFGEIPSIALGNSNPQMPKEELGVTTNAVEPLWAENFSAIRAANRFLQHAGNAYMDTVLRNRYLTEARALRAWYHLDLFLLYGPVPIIDKVIDLQGVNVKRNTEKEVIDFIVSELDACAPLLPLEYAGTADNYRITRGACYTMKTVALLNGRRYAEAAAAARQVIDLNQYELYPDYNNLFSYEGQQNKERIFIRNNGVQAAFYRNAPVVAGGTSNVNPTAALVNTYETRQGKTLAELGADSTLIYKKNPNFKSNRDPRLVATVLYPGSNFYGILDPFNDVPTNKDKLGALNSSRTGYWVKKYVTTNDKGKATSGTLDYLIYRYADVLLMYVEALVENGQWNHPDVVLYLNRIRTRAKMPPVNESVYNSEQQIRELYRRERRVELALEGSRLFDIRRWKIGETVMRGPVEGATNPANGQTVIAETRNFSMKDYRWPVPAREIQGNPAMEQNPGF